jgi:putative ABC transport system permease protein
VVRDATHFDLKEPPQRVFYAPYVQGPDFLQGENMILEVRSAALPASVAKQVREAVAHLDRNILVETETLQTYVDGSITRERLLAMLSGFFGVISLLLVAIGLYGVMAYSVARRMGEIGIRLALGALPTTILSMVMKEAFSLVLVGTAIGLSAAVASSHVLSAMLFGVTSRDGVAFAGAVGAIVLVALVATMLPARRASRVDPVVALRCE